jgi:hypothetical protein
MSTVLILDICVFYAMEKKINGGKPALKPDRNQSLPSSNIMITAV